MRPVPRIAGFLVLMGFGTPALQVQRQEPVPAAPATVLHAEPRPLAADARVEDWPGFLGPRHDASTAEAPLRTTWEEGGPRLLWEAPRGAGYAGPAVVDGSVVQTHGEGEDTVVECLDAVSGRRRWRTPIPCRYDGEIIDNDGARATPVVADGRVFVHDVAGGLHALDLASGELLWERDLRAELGAPDNFFGVVSSPLVHGGLLIQGVGGVPGPGVAAFDPATGELVWGSDPTGPARGTASCASPVIATVGGRERLFVLTGGKSRPPRGGLVVLDPREGTLEHEAAFRSRTYYSVNGASPLVAGDRVLLTASYGVGSVALGWDAAGELPGWRELWRDRRAQVQFGNPVHVDGRFYLPVGAPGGQGALLALDATSGEQHARLELSFEERVGGSTRTTSVGEASLLVAGTRILVLGDGGALFWVEAAGERPRVLSAVSLFHAPESWTPPVIAGGLLYVCQNNPDTIDGTGPRLLCYDVRGE